MIDYKKSLALNIYRRLTGDMETQFDNTEDIWTEIDRELAGNDGTVNIEELDVRYTSNGEYVFEPTDEVTAYAPVKIEVDCPVGFSFSEIGYDDELTKTINDDILEDMEYTKEALKKFEGIGFKTFSSLFKGDKKLVYAPYYELSPYWNSMTSTFSGCTNLKYVPLYDTSNVTSMGGNNDGMFYYCTSLKEVPLFDTSNVKSTYSMFHGCSSLKEVPLFDLSSCTNTENMFYGCSSLKEVPLFDLSSCTNMTAMFRNCSSLTKLPDFDTSNVTVMSGSWYGPFAGCSSLTEIPNWDFSKITYWYYMFKDCTSLTTITSLDTSAATDVSCMFSGCSSLTSLPPLDFSKVKGAYSTGSTFKGCTNLTNVGGLINYGMDSTMSSTISFNECSKLTYESAMNIINNLYDRTSAGYTSIPKIYFHKNTIALLSDEEKAIATNKGWTLS